MAKAIPLLLLPGEISLVVELARKRLQKIAVDANLHDRHGAEYASAVAASKERKKLRGLLAKLGDESVMDDV
jgi:NAD-dependent oxidoreductase involved in siderophore biosynthesis